MPFPFIAVATLALGAAATRDQIRNNQIAKNKLRRQAEAETKLLAEQISNANKQTLAEQDKRLPFQISLPSKPAESFEESSVISVAGYNLPISYILIGGMSLILLLVFRRGM